MEKTNQKPVQILFLFSDSGGGHRSAAEAIIEALHLEYGGRVQTEMVDFLQHYAPRPLNKLPELYTHMARVPRIWGAGYSIVNGRQRTRFVLNTVLFYTKNMYHSIFDEHPADLIVSVHPLANLQPLRVLRSRERAGIPRPPFITVVTDLVSTHAAWYDRFTDLCIVPTEAAKERGQRFKLAREKLRVVGLPVADRFCHPPQDRRQVQEALGWPVDKPTILLVGGGEGMGPLEKTARAIADADFNAGLAIICGRNDKLRARMEAQDWPADTFIYGFMRNMPDLMAAARILVTKAGPGTICEALNAGLPMILYSRLPGQEEGNVTYVVDEQAGIWAPSPEEIVEGLRVWLENPAQLERVASNCRRVARPQAARQIAHILAKTAGLSVE